MGEARQVFVKVCGIVVVVLESGGGGEGEKGGEVITGLSIAHSSGGRGEAGVLQYFFSTILLHVYALQGGESHPLSKPLGFVQCCLAAELY